MGKISWIWVHFVSFCHGNFFEFWDVVWWIQSRVACSDFEFLFGLLLLFTIFKNFTGCQKIWGKVPKLEARTAKRRLMCFVVLFLPVFLIVKVEAAVLLSLNGSNYDCDLVRFGHWWGALISHRSISRLWADVSCKATFRLGVWDRWMWNQDFRPLWAPKDSNCLMMKNTSSVSGLLVVITGSRYIFCY